MDFREFARQNSPRLQKELVANLSKIRAALSRETEQTKEMLDVYKRYVRNDATQEEMDRANQQFVSFLKSIGLGVLAVLPFSPVTIPAMVKLGKKVGIDILPDSLE